jgi:hypothetical protein
VIGSAQLRNRSSHGLARCHSVFGNGIANFHRDIIHQAGSAGNTDFVSSGCGELADVQDS